MRVHHMTTTPAMPEHIAHVEDWPDDRTSIGLVWDVDPKSVPVGTKLYALATLQAQPAEVSDEDILSLGQRNAWRYKYSSDPAHSSTYTFNDVCLVQFTRAILALRPQSVPMTDEVKEQALDLLATMFDAYENGVPCHEDNGGGYIGMAFSLDNETFHACADILNAHRPKAHHGITAPAGGEGV